MMHGQQNVKFCQQLCILETDVDIVLFLILFIIHMIRFFIKAMKVSRVVVIPAVLRDSQL